MKYLKKLVSGLYIGIFSVSFINKVHASNYKLILSAPSFGRVQIIGKVDDKTKFVYYSERFYDKYKHSYEKIFRNNKSFTMEVDKDFYTFIKQNGGPDSNLSATKISLCEEIDPNRGIREEDKDDRDFFSQYFKKDERLADALIKLF